jgi:hypothetical protein
VTEDFDKDVRRILGQLVEAREDKNDADKRLHDYRAAMTLPVPRPIHPSAWKGDSRNFAMTKFSEFRRRASGGGIMLMVERVGP